MLFGKSSKLRQSRNKADNGDDNEEAQVAATPSSNNDDDCEAIEQVYQEPPPHNNNKPSSLFAFDKDGYQYPNLFQEADEMTLLALLMYTVTDLRKMAKEQRLGNNPEKILQLPLTLDTALEVIEENLETIQKEEAGHEMALSALQSIQERCQQHQQRNQQSATSNNKHHSWFHPFRGEAREGFEQQQRSEPATVTAFGDDQPDKELVYAVGIDPFRKRITVAFRGSVTPVDFWTDACIEFQRHTLPDGTQIGIHHGFHEYLLKRRNKYEEILQHVKTLFAAAQSDDNNDRWQTYKLYVTGHSLGGALACLFAFQAATGNDVPKPVTCVSVASPRVGDESFQKAFTQLEQLGALRHLRIAHARDPIAMMPKTSSKKILAWLSPVVFLTLAAHDAQFTARETYRHTGVRLRLKSERLMDNKKEKPFELSYRGVTTVEEELEDDDKPDEKRMGWLSSFKASFSGIPGVSYHYGITYTEQLAKCKDELSSLTLNQLYCNAGQKFSA